MQGVSEGTGDRARQEAGVMCISYHASTMATCHGSLCPRVIYGSSHDIIK